MKKAIQLLRPSKVGPLGTSLLILICVLIHAIAVVFEQYKVLPLFYAIVFLTVLVNIFLVLRHKIRVSIDD